MLAFPSSAIRVLEPSATRLVVICPPFYIPAVLSFGVAALMFVGIWLAAARDLGAVGTLVLVALDVPFLLIGIGLGTARATAELDSHTAVLRLSNCVFGICKSRELPLFSVEGATVQRSKASYRVTFQLKDGSYVGLGYFTNQGGQTRAAAAINLFLQSHVESAGPNPK